MINYYDCIKDIFVAANEMNFPISLYSNKYGIILITTTVQIDIANASFARNFIINFKRFFAVFLILYTFIFTFSRGSERE